MRKTVLITGAAKGIGSSLVHYFAKNNYNVVINYLTSEKEALELKNTVEKLYDINALVVKADITNEDEVINMINIIHDKFGFIDVLINNAALAIDDNYIDKTKTDFLRVLEVNVIGTFLVTKYASKYMDNGSVINISSRDSVDTYNELSMDYCASKAGVNSLTQTFSLAIPSIKFISLLLPWVNTEAVKEMYQPFLENELKRTGQEKLLEPSYVAEKIYNIINNETIKSGSIINID